MSDHETTPIEGPVLSYPIWKKVIGTFGCGGGMVLFLVGYLLQRSDVSAFGFQLGLFCLALSVYMPLCPSCGGKMILLAGAHPDHCSRCGGVLKKSQRKVGS